MAPQPVNFVVVPFLAIIVHDVFGLSATFFFFTGEVVSQMFAKASI